MESPDTLVAALSACAPATLSLGAAPVSDRFAELYPLEATTMCNAVQKRRNEFSTGRWLARELLGSRGIARQAIGRAAQGNPIWPEGIRGSISHSRDICLAVIGAADEFQGIGVDLEFDAVTDPEVQALILTRREQRLYATPELCRLVFSAKEAFFKAVFEQHGRFIDFHAVETELEPGSRKFTIDADDVETGEIDGRYFVSPTCAATLCLITARSAT